MGPGSIVSELALATRAAERGITYHQVKEKMGGLRVYYEAPIGTDTETRNTIRQLIRDAGQQAGRTCDECGQPGQPRNLRRLLDTRCDAHAHRPTSA
jgi:hypothetical protein